MKNFYLIKIISFAIILLCIFVLLFYDNKFNDTLVTIISLVFILSLFIFLYSIIKIGKYKTININKNTWGNYTCIITNFIDSCIKNGMNNRNFESYLELSKEEIKDIKYTTGISNINIKFLNHKIGSILLANNKIISIHILVNSFTCGIFTDDIYNIDKYEGYRINI